MDEVYRGFVGPVELVGFLDHRYFVAGHTGLSKSLDDVSFDAPGYGTSEALRRRRHERHTDLEQLRDKRGVAWDPVPHNDAAARFCDPHHFFGDIERFWREHRSEHRDGYVEGMVPHPFQIAGITLLELQPGETGSLRAFIPRFDQVAGDIDSYNFRTQTRQGKCGGAIAAAEVQNAQLRCDTERLGDGFSGLTHESSDFREITFFPQRLIWIHEGSLKVVTVLRILYRNCYSRSHRFDSFRFRRNVTP